jgi:hypothetical protein
MRGMDFGDIVNGDHTALSGWLIENYTNKKDRSRLEDFDLWMDDKLKWQGYVKTDPIRKFKQFSNIDEDNNIKVKTKSLKKAEIPTKKREKKTRDIQFNIFVGTKKEYVYQLGKSLYIKYHPKYTTKEIISRFFPQVLERVEKKFPDQLKEKSIRIWIKRSLDALSKKTKN